jgi:RsiW-degrading membrane proteinase PrsW (M82 family)
MTYIENIFVCIAAPLLVAALCMGRKYYRVFFFCFAGMAACLLSAYINTFFARLYGADLINATMQIAPVLEEIMKLLPLLFYLLIFEPKAEKINAAVLIVATSFATFENICYLTQNGAAQLSFLLIRGFGTGAMHIVCGAVVSLGLVYVWQRGWLRVAGTCGLLCAAITFHAVYNLLIAYGGNVQYIAYVLPVLTITIRIGAGKLLKAKSQHKKTYPSS